MNTLRGWIEIIGIAAVIASLIFVGVELQQSRAIAIGDGNLANAEVQIERNNSINEHVEVWIKGNSGERLSEEETTIIGNLVENATIHSFMEYARLTQLEFPAAAQSVTAEFAIFLHQHPLALEMRRAREQLRSSVSASPPTRVKWRNEVVLKLEDLTDEAVRGLSNDT